jgi:hypothetical protein
MTGSRSKPCFVRRSRPEDRTNVIEVLFNEEEYAIVEAKAVALGLSLEDFIVARILDAGRIKGNA